ncbi:hypothetical protein QJS10_CPA05g02444 [Acorus calamus]|uniref:Uncharacterized protein n=1 Tax=Acorus calamus TaxID=4465 RepID=A0AAV9EVS5_ACOCL|nr:hypothetical protein QJS10_CPA05g02444 [Acorus calamus]
MDQEERDNSTESLLLKLNFVSIRRTSKEVKILPPMNMRRVMTRSWRFEKDSISMTDMLETVEAETDVKKISKLLEGSLGGKAFKRRKPRRE